VSSAGEYTLSGATVLLCGASGGIGAALATELEARGAQVTGVGRDPGRLHATPAANGHLAIDLRDAGACEQAVALAAGEDGNLDVLINAVGISAFGAATELTEDAMRELLEVNVLVPMLLARAALPRMQAGAVIANVSGIIAEPGRAMAGMSAYAASKAAVRAFDESLAREARRAKVRVLDIRPPHTETGLAQRPIAGQAPALPRGLDPAFVATVICDALESGARDLPSEAFTP
jgi:cyclic-di-GMP-binding biofilm dispersal mediator protein